MIHKVSDRGNCGYKSIHLGPSLTQNDITYEDKPFDNGVELRRDF